MHSAPDHPSRGWRLACLELAYRVAQRSLSLDVTHLMVLDLQKVERFVGFGRFPFASFRLLSRPELQLLTVNSDSKPDSELLARLDSGFDFCFGAIVDGELAAYVWLAVNRIEAEHNRGTGPDSGVALSFPADTVFTYNAWVYPKYRGRSLHARLVLAAGRWARWTLGSRLMISTTDWLNHASLRSCRRTGRKSLGLIWRLGFPRCMFTVAPKRAAQYGIRFGRHAEPVCRERSMPVEPSVDLLAS